MTTPSEPEVPIEVPGPPSLPFVLGATLLLALTAALAAAITATLVPLRTGTVLIPLAVVLAVVANVVLPTLAARLTAGVGSAGLTVAVWVIVVLLLSQSRPEGDVILPGSPNGTVAVVYATMLGGLVAGLVTVVRLGRRPRPVAGPAGSADGQPKR